ncbi:MAG TPA: Crp/Fnr family transcriptional regulator, partial [Actinomycetota bacterium]|nr:Crp/Fnr family transcriptional regulator [Actinomycetota bacterium]
LEPLLRRIALTTRQALFEPGQDIQNVWFPVSGVISLVAAAADHASVHVASVGPEGVAGVPLYFGAGSAPNLRAVALMPGVALTLPAGQFVQCLEQSARMRQLVGWYAHALLTQAAQEVACNRRHSGLQRCSCWLLVTADRARSAEFPMTQEFLAELLGTRRASVVAGARTLQDAGAIRYRRGRITIADRARLEAFACGCYPVIRQSLAFAG